MQDVNVGLFACFHVLRAIVSSRTNCMGEPSLLRLKEYDTEIEEMLDGMNKYELAEILTYLVGTDEKISELVENALKKEQSERPYVAVLRKELSKIIEYTSDEYDFDEDDDRVLFIATNLEHYSKIDYRDKDQSCRFCRQALDKANESAKPFEVFRNVLLLCRMLLDSDKWRCLSTLAELQKEYLPNMLHLIIKEMKPQERELLMRWVVENEKDEEYSFLIGIFMKTLSDRKELKLLKKIREEKFNASQYFDSNLFNDLIKVMTALKEWDEIESLCSEYIEEWDVAKILGDMYFGRKMYDEALKCYKIYYDQLFSDEDWSFIADLLDFFCENISCFSDTETLRKMYEKVVMGGRIAFRNEIQALYRLTPDDGKEEIKSRFLSMCGDGIDDEFVFRAFSTDAEIRDLYRKGKVSKKDLSIYCSHVI